LTLFCIFQVTNKQHHRRDRAQKILFTLILILFLCRTGQVASEWYYIWNAFINHGTTSDEIFSALNMGAKGAVITTRILMSIKIAIADSIIVSGRCKVLLSAILQANI
jgi:hypothetical protein